MSARRYSRISHLATALVAVTAALLVAASMATVAVAVPGPGEISGTVRMGDLGDYSRAGQPVEGIAVSLYRVLSTDAFGNPTLFTLPSTLKTDSSGFFDFTGLPAASGTGTSYVVGVAQGATDSVGTDYDAWFSDSGATTPGGATPITLNVDDVYRVDDKNLFPSPVGPSITGVIKGSDFTPKLPIVGAEIDGFVLRTDPDIGDYWSQEAFAMSDSEGTYAFWNLPSAAYRIGYGAPMPDGYGVRWRSEYWTPTATATGVGAKTLDGAADVDFSAGTQHLQGYGLTLDKAKKVITGSVFERGTTTKLAGADVNLFDLNHPGDEPLVGTYTDDSGDYAIWDDQLPATPVPAVLQFREWTYDENWYNDVAFAENGTVISASSSLVPTSNVNGYLRKLAPAIEGTVTDAGGAPVQNVAVGFYETSQNSDAEGPWDSTFTDAHGHYEWYWYGDPQDFKVRFFTGQTPDANWSPYSPGQAPATHMNQWFDRKKNMSVAATLTLAPESDVIASQQLDDNLDPSITGSVRAASGAPIQGVTPEADRWNPDMGAWELVNWGTTSDASGSYKVWGLGVGTYIVGVNEGFQANDRYYRQAWYNGQPGPDTATGVTTANGSTVSGVNISPAELQPFIGGTVTNAKTSAPISGAYVMLLHDIGGGNWDFALDDWIRTKPDGTWAVYGSAPEAEYRVQFGADGYADEYYDNQVSADLAQSIPVALGQTASADASLTPLAYKAMRYDGHDFGVSSRYSVCANVADLMTEGFDYNPDIILACGEDRAMADPLAAGGLSWAYHNAPLLLTPAGPVTANYLHPAVPPFVLDGITYAVAHVRATHRADGITLHVVGGTGSVPDARISEIRHHVQVSLGLSASDAARAVKLDRTINGATRYDNALLIARVMKAQRGSEMPAMAFVVNGLDPTKFWDAMAVAPIAAGRGIPLILTQTTAAPSAATRTKTFLGLAGSQLYAVGPTSHVAASAALGATNRIGGSATTQYALGKSVADWGILQGLCSNDTVAVTAAMPDALGAGPYLGVRHGTILFATQGSLTLPSQTSLFLSAHKATLRDVFIFGGSGSVTTKAELAINNALKP